MKIQKINKVKEGVDCLVHIEKLADLGQVDFSKEELAYIKAELKKEKELVAVNQYSHKVYVIKPKKNKEETRRREALRSLGDQVGKQINAQKGSEIAVIGTQVDDLLLVVEGIALGNYQFKKYVKDKKELSLVKIGVLCGDVKKAQLDEILGLTESVFVTRDLVNEPLSYLTAPQLAKDIQKLGKKCGFSVKVFNKKKIEELKMGGLLAVNRGSFDPPTFSILEWKPKNAKNKKPIVLVGKGVVYDTGGVSLKPTPNSMDLMKSDMAGAGMMVGTMCAVSKNKLPLHVIALIPATDNRPGKDAYVPGDVIKMHSGLNVEVWNTDAEGRMLLADALHYAKNYDPELVIDSATLTGAAVRAFGTAAACVMGTADDKVFDALEVAGNEMFERVWRQPFWSEYGDALKSDIADIKNLGGPYGGHISAGKFLEYFTDYPWVHIDIAGPAFLSAPSSYRPKWGSGYGVRLLYSFLANRK